MCFSRRKHTGHAEPAGERAIGFISVHLEQVI